MPRIHLRTPVYLLPARSPVHPANANGSLAALFPGRLELGADVGWLPDKYAATGSDFGTRGKRLDEGIERMRLLWQGESVSYAGKHHRVDGIRLEPRPSVVPPILVGGRSAAAITRAARRGGGGFVAMPSSAAEFRSMLLPELGESLAAAGRSLDGFWVAASLPGLESADELDALGERERGDQREGLGFRPTHGEHRPARGEARTGRSSREA